VAVLLCITKFFTGQLFKILQNFAPGMQRAWFFLPFSGKKTEATAEPGAARPGARKNQIK